jgi:hypothetical protein
MAIKNAVVLQLLTSTTPVDQVTTSPAARETEMSSLNINCRITGFRYITRRYIFQSCIQILDTMFFLKRSVESVFNLLTLWHRNFLLNLSIPCF